MLNLFSRLKQSAGFTIAEVMSGLAVLGIVLLAMPTNFKHTMTASTTSDAMVAEALIFKDASNVLASQPACNQQFVTTGPAVVGFPTPAGHMAQVSLSPSCSPVASGSYPLPSTYNYSGSGQVGICAGGIYDNKVAVSSVSLENVTSLGGGGNYSADVLVQGYKLGQVYGTTAVARTMKVVFNGTLAGGNVTFANCLGSQVSTSPTMCKSLGGVWGASGMCNMCTAFNGIWNGTYCELNSLNCFLPAGIGWIGADGFSECSSATAITVSNGGQPVTLVDLSAPFNGQENISCTNGVPSVVGTVTCNVNACTVNSSNFSWPSTTGGPSCIPNVALTIPVGTTQVATSVAPNGVGQAAILCPVEGGTPQVLAGSSCVTPGGNCSILANSPIAGWVDSAGNPCLTANAVAVPFNTPSTSVNAATPYSGTYTFSCGPTGIISTIGTPTCTNVHTCVDQDTNTLCCPNIAGQSLPCVPGSAAPSGIVDWCGTSRTNNPPGGSCELRWHCVGGFTTELVNCHSGPPL
jgi:hypothetical protein